MKLCIVRHGETAWNAEGRIQGQLDLPLNRTGLAQARAVAQALAEERFDAIYCSDLQRARQTAEPYAVLSGSKIRLDEKLRERHYGIFQGITYNEARERMPEDFARFKAKDPEYDFRSGESLLAFRQRALAFFANVTEKHKGESVLVVTHGGILEILYRHATGRGLSAPRDFEVPNAALNRFEHGGDAWKVWCWADVGHLAAALDDLPD